MGGRGGGSVTTTEYFSKSAMRSNSSSGSDTIIRFDAEKLITIDGRKIKILDLNRLDRISKLG